MELARGRLKAAAASAQPPSLYVGEYSIAVTRDMGAARSPIAGRRLVKWNSGTIRYVGNVVQAASSFPASEAGTNRAVTYSNAAGAERSSNRFFFEFRTDAPVLELAYAGTGPGSVNRVLVDGKYLGFDRLQGSDEGDTNLTRVTFPERAMRTIRVEAQQLIFYGVFVGNEDVVELLPAPVSPPVRALILGDSYTEGTSGVAGVNDFEVYAQRTARALGWLDFYGSGVGATGYLADYNGRFKTFRQRLDTDVIPFKPEVLIVAGGINDPLEGLQEEAVRTFDAIRAGLPDTIIFVLGPWSPSGGQERKAQAIRSAAANRPGFYFIDNVGEQWQTGNGTITNPNGSGNADRWTGADGAHLTQEGHIGISDRLIAAIKAWYMTW